MSLAPAWGSRCRRCSGWACGSGCAPLRCSRRNGASLCRGLGASGCGGKEEIDRLHAMDQPNGLAQDNRNAGGACGEAGGWNRQEVRAFEAGYRLTLDGNAGILQFGSEWRAGRGGRPPGPGRGRGGAGGAAPREPARTAARGPVQRARSTAPRARRDTARGRTAAR